MKPLKTSHEFARELLALPDLTIMHLDPSFADACDEETDHTVGVPTAEVVDPFMGLDAETIEELKEQGVGRFITISGDQPAEWDRQPADEKSKDTQRMDWMADSYGAAGMTQAEAENEARAYEKAYTEAKRRGMSDRVAVRAAVDVALALQSNTQSSATPNHGH